MAATQVGTTPKSKAVPNAALGALFEAEQNSVDAATRVYSSVLGNAVRVQTELLRFMSERFAKDALMLEAFASCRRPADIAELQLKLGSDAIADYFAETQKLIGVFEKVAGENLKEVS